VRRFIPWLLLGILGVITGLGIGLGLGNAPSQQSASQAVREPQVASVAPRVPTVPAYMPSPPTASTSTPTDQNSITTTTTPVTATATRCNADQLQIRFVGEQGATGNIVAAFWIADVLSTPCVLESSVSVELIGRNGSGQLYASRPITQPITLTGPAVVPTDNVAPTNAQLASLVLEWPTDSDTSPYFSDVCPGGHFMPSAARFMFANGGSDLVTDLVANSLVGQGQTISICGRQFGIPVIIPVSG
jgi:hypothetical protein